MGFSSENLDIEAMASKNVESVGRIIKSVLAIVFSLLYLNNMVTGVLGVVLLVVSAIFLITSSFSFCPTYWLFKVNTCRTKDIEK